MSRSRRLVSSLLVAMLCTAPVRGALASDAPRIVVTDDRGHTTTFAQPPNTYHRFYSP